MANKLACEELAHYLEGHYRADVNLIEGKSYASQAKRLRAEGQELKRLRKLFAEGATVDRGIGFRGVLAQNRIQKARKAK